MVYLVGCLEAMKFLNWELILLAINGSVQDCAVSSLDLLENYFLKAFVRVEYLQNWENVSLAKNCTFRRWQDFLTTLEVLVSTEILTIAGAHD